MRYLTTKAGKLYLMFSADDYPRDEDYRNVLLIHTGIKDATGRMVKEFKARSLRQDEIDTIAWLDIPRIMFKKCEHDTKNNPSEKDISQ